MAKWNYDAQMEKAKELDTQGSSLSASSSFSDNYNALKNRAAELDNGAAAGSLKPMYEGITVVSNNPSPYSQAQIDQGPVVRTPGTSGLTNLGAGIANRIENAITPKVETPEPAQTSLGKNKLSVDMWAMDPEMRNKYGTYENYLMDIVTDEYKTANPNSAEKSRSQAMEDWRPGSSTSTQPISQPTTAMDYTSGMVGGPVTAADRALLQNEQDVYALAQQKQNENVIAAAELGFNTLEAFRQYQQAKIGDEERARKLEEPRKQIDFAVNSANNIQSQINALTAPNYGAGNINLSDLPRLDNGDGTYSSVDSISFRDDKTGLEILIPTVVRINGQWQHVDEAQAIEQYYKTGKYLGAFNTPEEADAYAIRLHRQQEDYFDQWAKLSAQAKTADALVDKLVNEYNNGVYKEYIESHDAFLQEYEPVAYYYGLHQNYDDIQNVLTGLKAQLDSEPAGTTRWNTLKRQYDQLYTNRMIFADDGKLTDIYKGGALDEETRRKIDERLQYDLDHNLYTDPLTQDPELKALLGDSDHERNWLAAGQEIQNRDFQRVAKTGNAEVQGLLAALAVYASTGSIPDEAVVDLLGQKKYGLATNEGQIIKAAKDAMARQGFSEQEIANTIDLIKRQANTINADKMRQELSDYATSGVAEGMGAYVLSFLTSATSAISLVEPIRAEFSKSTNRTLDPNSKLFTMSNATNAIRTGITGAVDWNYQGVDMFDEAFGIVTSGIESFLASRIPGKIAGMNLGALVLSGNAAAESLLESAQRGTPIGEAVLSAGIAGTFEALFENMSIGNLKALQENPFAITYGDIIKNIEKSILVNFEEEGATTLANAIFDWLKNTPTSNFNTSVGELMTQINPVTGKVYTEKEAKAKTWANTAEEVLHDAATGAIQGALMAGVSQISAISRAHSVEKYNKELYKIGLNASIANGYIGNATIASMYTDGEARAIGRKFVTALDAIIESKEADSVKQKQYETLLNEMKSDLEQLPQLLRTDAKLYAPEGVTDAVLQQYIDNVRGKSTEPVHIETELESKVRIALGWLNLENVGQKEMDAAKRTVMQVASGAESVSFAGVDNRILTSHAFSNAVKEATGYTINGNGAAAVKRSLQAIANTIRDQTVEVNKTSTEVKAQDNLVNPGPSLVVTGGDDTAAVVRPAPEQATTPSGIPLNDLTRQDWYEEPKAQPAVVRPAPEQATTPSGIPLNDLTRPAAQPTEMGEKPAPAQTPVRETVAAEQPVTTEPTIRSGDQDLTEAQFVQLATSTGEFTAEQARESFQRMLAGDQSHAEEDRVIRLSVAEAQGQKTEGQQTEGETETETETEVEQEKPTGPIREAELDDATRRMQAVMNFYLSDKGMRLQYSDDPRLAGENGFIDLKTGTIYVNINAPAADPKTQAGLAWILGHEIFHGANLGQDSDAKSLIDQVLGTYDENGAITEDGLIQKLADSGALTGYYAEIAKDPEKMKQAVADMQERYRNFYKDHKYSQEDIDRLTTADLMREEIAGDIFGAILGINEADEYNGKLGTTLPRQDLFERIAGIDPGPLHAAELSLKERLNLMRETGMKWKELQSAYDTQQQQVKSLLYDISLALEGYRGKLEQSRETNGGKPAPEDINPDFADAKLSVATPYTGGSADEQKFVDGLSPEARETYDLFDTIHKIGTDNKAQVWVGLGERRHLEMRDIAATFMLPSEWNDYVANDPMFADTARKLAESLPDSIRREANINADGTISETPFEKEFKMSRSFTQRIVDALPMQATSSTITSGGREVRVSEKESINSVGGEAYRRALVEERRKLYAEGNLPTKPIKGLGKDEYGAMGFLATNSKTIASGDFTTLCPQMYYNKGCFYCYRRSQLTTGMNLKLLGESVWYTGEILQLQQKDIDRLNKVGGLRIQSFGDWMEQYSGQLADMLMDADTVGLQVKVITKEPSMIKTVALLKDQGLGKSVFFNLSADYVIEPRGEIHNTDQQDRGWDPSNPERPYMTDEQGVSRWKRALTVEEAYEYRKQYPWVYVRIVAGRTEEFIRGLKDPRVQVVTGFHGNKSVINRLGGYGYVDSATGETVLELEPIGDNGMPRFAYDPNTKNWVMEYAGKTKVHHKLAQAISDEGLEAAYYMKACCITGQCATCQGTCGKAADNIYMKNATNADSVAPAFWQTNMQSDVVENPLILDEEAENANAMLQGEADDQLQEEEDLRLPSVQRHSVAEMQAAGEDYGRKIMSGTFFSGGGLVDYALRDQINSSMAVEWDKGAAAVFALNNGQVYVGDVRDYVKGEDIQKLKGKLEYFHASPVCKNYSRMNINRAVKSDSDLDMVTAQSTADAIGILTPKVFTLEQVPEYLGSDALKIITDRLDALGYTWDVNVANAFDYGGATSRERLMLRAVREGQFPALPQKSSGYSWYEATSDLLDSLPDVPVQPFLQERIDNTPRLIDALSRAETPILVLSGNASRQARWITADKPCPSITTKMDSARIIFPDGTVKKATPRFFARTMGLPDSYQFTQWRGRDNETQGYKVVGNGVPVQLTQAFFGNLLRDTIGSQAQYVGTEYANEDVRRSIAGPKSLQSKRRALEDQGITSGQEYDTVQRRLYDLGRARLHEVNGKSVDEIFNATHWWKDPADDMWRYEINDENARFVKRGDAALRSDPNYEAARKEYRSLKRAMKERQLSEEELKRHNELKQKVVGEREAAKENFWRGGGKIGDVIDHKQLFDAYPELRDVPFSFEHFSNRNLGGHFIPSENKIELNDRFLGDTAAAQKYRNEWKSQLAPGMDATEENMVLSILLHEMQHKIQHIEGFAAGGSTDRITNAQKSARRGKQYYQGEARKLGRKIGLDVDRAIALLRSGGSLDVISNTTGEVVATITPDASTENANIWAVEKWLAAERDAGNITYSQWDDARRIIPQYMWALEDYDYSTMLNGTTANASELYQSLRGEQEANLVQKRQNMTAKERWANRPQMPEEYKLADIMDRITGRYDILGENRDPFSYSVADPAVNTEYNNSQETVGTPLRTMAYAGKTGGNISRMNGVVGKNLGTASKPWVYFHRNYLEDAMRTANISREDYDKAETILKVSRPELFDRFNYIVYNADKHTITFGFSPDFDTAREPRAGEQLQVNYDTGKTQYNPDKKAIFHHKWLWVEDDYRGFDHDGIDGLQEAWDWSKQWLNALRPAPELGGANAPRGIADGTNIDAWNRQLDHFGLPRDGEQVRMSVADRQNGVNAEGNEYEFVDMPKYQDHTSAGTSLPSNAPTVYKALDWKPGTKNLDIGGGRTEFANDLLRSKGVKNNIMDPYNRDADYNLEAVRSLIEDGKYDTVTCANVLNVIDSAQSRRNVILEAAKALKPDGTAYFQIYEGDGKGETRETSKGSQENRKTSTYLEEVRQWFNNVEQYKYDTKTGKFAPSKSGNIIVASDPKADLPKAYWEYEEGKAVRYSAPDSASSRTQDQQIMDLVRRLQQQQAQDTGVGTPRAGFTQSTNDDVEDWYTNAKSFLPISDEQKNNTQDHRATRQAVQFPSVDKSGGVESRTAQTIANSGITDDVMKQNIEQAAANGEFRHLPYSDAKAMGRARGEIERNGWDQEYAKYKDAVDKGITSKDNTVMGIALYNNAVTAKDYYAALDIVALMVKEARNTAAALQARRILNKLGPEGQLYMAVRGVENIADEFRKLYPNKQLTLDRSLIEAYRDALISGDQDAIEQTKSDIFDHIADQLGADWKEKLRNWRYLSMLFNPQTHIRNIVGNAGFAIPRLMKQANKAMLERIRLGEIGKGSKRTTAVLNPLSQADRDRFKAGWDDYADVMDIIQSGGKQTGPRDEIEKRRTIFDKNWQKPIEWAREKNSWLLDIEDTWFSRPAYAEALASFLKARGIDADDYANGNISEEDRARAQSHAVKEAQKATYRDHNQFSDMISDIAKRGRAKDATTAEKLKSTAVEAALPFKRTPANIAARAWEYSPFEAINIIFSDIKQIRAAQAATREAEMQNNGSEESIRAVNAAQEAEAEKVSDMLDHVASAGTGSVIMAIGALFARMGLIHGGKDDDDKQAAFNKLRGQQEYSIDINGRNYTLDWLAPEILPLLTGVELYNTLSDHDSKNENGIIGDLGDILLGLTEPMLNMTMLSSINDLIADVKYLEDGRQLGGIAKNLAMNYASQYVPTLAGKLENVVSPIINPDKRYYEQNFVDKNAMFGKDEQNFWSNIANKLPGYDYNQATYYDAWGRKQDNGDLLQRAMRNLVYPWRQRDLSATPFDDELQRLKDNASVWVEETGKEYNVLPQHASWSTQVDKQYMTADEYELYTRVQGETQFKLVSDLLSSDVYSKLSDGEKAKAISELYPMAKIEAENAVRKERGVEPKETAAEKAGLDPSVYVTTDIIYNTATTPTGYHPTSTGNAPGWAKALAVLNDTSLSQADRLAFINAKSTRKEPFKSYKEAKDYYEKEKEKDKK